MAANETPNGFKISWTPPGRGSDGLLRADGARYKIGTGLRGTYEWVVKDGLWAAYHYPGGVQTRAPVVLMPPQGSLHKAYRACVEHNNFARSGDEKAHGQIDHQRLVRNIR